MWHPSPSFAVGVFVFCALAMSAFVALSTRGRRWDHLEVPRGRVVAIIPSFNEAPEVLYACVESILGGSVVPDLVYVVDDGSTPPVEPYQHERVVWLRQDNLGKRQAQVNGLSGERDRADYIVTMDSDSIVGHDCLRDCLRALGDKRVQAVTATVAVLNRTTNWLTRLTDLEIVYGCLVMRGVRSACGAVAPTAGTFAAYRAAIFFDHTDDYLTSGTVGDDRRLTHYSLLRGQVVAVESAIVHTLMPTTPREMFQQRSRWFKSYFRYLPWELQNLNGTPLAFRVWGTVLFVIYPLMVGWAFVVVPLSGGRLYWELGVYWAALMYCQTARYIAYERPDMTLHSRVLVWLVGTPLLAPLNALVMRPSMYWAARSARTTHWQTRGDTVRRDGLQGAA